jgi:hypothetical protein
MAGATLDRVGLRSGQFYQVFDFKSDVLIAQVTRDLVRLAPQGWNKIISERSCALYRTRYCQMSKVRL